MQGYDASTYGERFADVYDDWYGGVSDVEGTVALVAEVAGGAPVLELGIGTGRLALPLAALGLEVHGIDASSAMVERLRAKPGGDDVAVVVGDFADVGASVPGGFGAVLCAFNTLFNLTTAAAQGRCFAAVAERLRPGGGFLVEAYVPEVGGPDAPSHSVVPSIVGLDRVVLLATQEDRAAQTVTGSTISITEAEGVRLRPWFIRYSWPEELDAMATAAGLVVEGRWAGWRREPFSDDSPRHVTLYRRTGR